MGFKLPDFTNMPSDEERVAEALATIEIGLKGIDDPAVRCRDDESPGLLMLLEQCVSADPTWDMAMAVKLAFDLGKAAVLGKADPAALQNLRAAAKARRQGARNSRIEPVRRAEEWKTVARRIMDAASAYPGDEEITKDIRSELEKLRMTRSRRTVFNYVRELRRPTH
jgi:hypothetical protein